MRKEHAKQGTSRAAHLFQGTRTGVGYLLQESQYKDSGVLCMLGAGSKFTLSSRAAMEPGSSSGTRRVLRSMQKHHLSKCLAKGWLHASEKGPRVVATHPLTQSEAQAKKQ
eukprot:1156350-Pelagomonas_calceolata.AAC.16